MIYPYGGLKFPAPFSDTRVDDIMDADGQIDQFAPIDLQIKDKQLIENINDRIDDSRTYYNDLQGFNLEAKRAENLRMYLGIQADSLDFYDGEEPYIENQIRGAVDSIVAYATARNPQSQATPADDTPWAKKFASNLEKAHALHSEKYGLRDILAIMVRSWLLNQEAYCMLEFDPGVGDKGDIVPRFLPCDEIVVDKNARYGDNPEFIAIFEKHSVADLVFLFPEKKKEIFDSMNIQRAGKNNIQQEIVVRKIWFTYYGKDGKPEEAVAVYYDEVMLAKYRDLNWLEGKKNFLDAPMKPIIPLNVINDGKHWIDFATPLDDSVKMQKLLNQRGRQISLNAARSNGTVVVNGKASGLTKEDVENWTGYENQKIYLKKAKEGVALDQMITNVEGKDLKEFVIQDKQDMRAQVAGLVGAPGDQTGSDLAGDDPTLGQALLKKNNNSARQDMIVRALDSFLYKYFNLLTQMMFVWYDEEHYFPYLDSDGSFENIVIKRYYFDEGMRVNVKASSTIAFDKNREQAMALHFAEKNQISMLDAYRIAGFENPQKLYDNWAKQQKDPYELVRDTNDQYDDANAYAEFLEFMNGKIPRERMDASREFIMTLRKLMATSDIFLHAKSKYQEAFVKRLTLYVEKFALKQSLDQLGQSPGMQAMMVPNDQIPPPMPPQPMGQSQMGAPAPAPGQMGMPPGGMPPGGAPQQPQMQPRFPGGPPPFSNPGGPSGQGVFGGTPFVNPANPQTPGSMSAIPVL